MRTDRTTGVMSSKRLCAALALSAAAVAQAATFNIFNIDPPGVGFNDATPATPVGGNTGTTLGEQRQIVFLKVAEIWGARLQSDVPIRVLASFSPLFCTSTQAVLGAAGPRTVFIDVPNAEKQGTWYPGALANKLAGVALVSNPDPLVGAEISARFNGNLGNAGCLDGSPFYLGLDNNEGAEQVDLLATVLHEFGHGLGFLSLADEATGRLFPYEDNPALNAPSIWEHFLLDTQQRKLWTGLNNDERVASAIVPRNLVWQGRRVTNAAPRVLERGVAELFVTGQGLNKFLFFGQALFGPQIDRRTLVAQPLVAVVDQGDGRGLACAPLDAANAAAVRGKIALIDRGGTCGFIDKARNAQAAGARAALYIDNMPGSPPEPVGVAPDDTITIPSGLITQADGAAIKAALAAARPPLNQSYGVLFLNQLRLAGADYGNRLYMYTPNPVRPGSSVSHYDRSARRNLLMEPNISGDLTSSVNAPEDLTLELFRDIGW
jgi:PA domain